MRGRLLGGLLVGCEGILVGWSAAVWLGRFGWRLLVGLLRAGWPAGQRDRHGAGVEVDPASARRVADLLPGGLQPTLLVVHMPLARVEQVVQAPLRHIASVRLSRLAGARESAAADLAARESAAAEIWPPGNPAQAEIVAWTCACSARLTR